jgi:hypothetical protein
MDSDEADGNKSDEEEDDEEEEEEDNKQNIKVVRMLTTAQCYCKNFFYNFQKIIKQKPEKEIREDKSVCEGRVIFLRRVNIYFLKKCKKQHFLKKSTIWYNR